MTVGARHAGLVLALALRRAAPVEDAVEAPQTTRRLARGGAVLEGDADLRPEGAHRASLLRRCSEQSGQGEIPDLAPALRRRSAAEDSGLQEMRDDLVTTLDTRHAARFHSSFALSALLALVALALRRRLRRATCKPGRVLAASMLIAVDVFIVASSPQAPLDFGVDAHTADRARPRRASRAGGIDGAIQRSALSAMSGAACYARHVPRGARASRLCPSTNASACAGQATIDLPLQRGQRQARGRTPPATASRGCPASSS